MFNAVRSSLRLRAQFSPLTLSSRKTTGIRLAQAVSGPDTTDKMQEQGSKKTGLYGEGHSKRADEEGFGGIYAGNQPLTKDDEDKIVHGNAPGSEVLKEKERAQNQGKVPS
ncbi:hypothetical protein ACJIZ3_002238 [Penstemon smallii]|uniref:Uncharacterized protein n=1 Tax=Penstemon smallii TaxID=265156 RepID=A0ABD3U690_9LAMI